MNIFDKIALVSLIKAPSFGLSSAQICEIEDILSGRPKDQGPMVMSYAEAAKRIGLRSKNSVKTVCLWVKQGKLDVIRPSGKKAIGVTVESVERFAKAYLGFKGGKAQ